MKKAVSLGLLGFLVMVGATSSAWAWGSATHAYMNYFMEWNRQSAGPPQLRDLIYGGVVPDAFNYLFDYPAFLAYLADQAHHEFMKVWQAKQLFQEWPDALGFVSHNDTWGEDSTAHRSSRTLLSTEGYVVTKAKELHQFLWANSEDYRNLSALGITEDLYLELCHEMVEAAGDVLITRIKPDVGKVIADAAVRPSKDMVNLLLRAYADDFAAYTSSIGQPLSLSEASSLIVLAEQGFRQFMVSYGTLLQQDEATILAGLVAQYNSMIGKYLAAMGITLPPGSDMTPLIENALNYALFILSADFRTEVDATKSYVGSQLIARLK